MSPSYSDLRIALKCFTILSLFILRIILQKMIARPEHIQRQGECWEGITVAPRFELTLALTKDLVVLTQIWVFKYQFVLSFQAFEIILKEKKPMDINNLLSLISSQWPPSDSTNNSFSESNILYMHRICLSITWYIKLFGKANIFRAHKHFPNFPTGFPAWDRIVRT